MILYIYIKCFFLLLIPPYIFAHLLNKKTSYKKMSICILTSIICAFSVYFVSTYSPILIYLTLLVITTIICAELFGESFLVTLQASVISNAFTTIVFFIASLIVTPIVAVIAYFSTEYIGIAIAMFISGFIQLLIIYLIFKISRFKKGMPFLSKIHKVNGLTIVSALLIFIASLMTYQKGHNWIFSLYYGFILFSGITIYILWRLYIKKAYLNLVREREINNLEDIVKRQKLTIDKLEVEHDKLAQIVHRDNKIVPSLIMYIEEIITVCGDNNNLSTSSLDRLNKTKEDLRTLMFERSSNLSIKDKKIFSFYSGISELDAIINFQINKARDNDIELSTSINTQMQYISPTLISTFDLTTIIGDLLDNAIHACSDSSNELKKNNSINLTFAKNEDCYFIKVSDSGMPFDKKVLNNLGIMKITSRKKIGGSGIGMFSTVYILKKYKASLCITDSSNGDDNTSFNKDIGIYFDNKDEIRVNHHNVEYVRNNTL